MTSPLSSGLFSHTAASSFAGPLLSQASGITQSIAFKPGSFTESAGFGGADTIGSQGNSYAQEASFLGDGSKSGAILSGSTANGLYSSANVFGSAGDDAMNTAGGVSAATGPGESSINLGSGVVSGKDAAATSAGASSGSLLGKTFSSGSSSGEALPSLEGEKGLTSTGTSLFGSGPLTGSMSEAGADVLHSKVK